MLLLWLKAQVVFCSSIENISNREHFTIGKLVDELEYRLPEAVARSDFAAMQDDGDRYITKANVPKNIEKRPQLYALWEMNILGRSEVDIKECTDFDAYNAAKYPLPLILNIIRAHELALTADSLGDAGAAVQAYHTMKQMPRESTNKYRKRMEDTIKVIEELGLE